MKDKKSTREPNIHHMCHEHLEYEVEVITVNGEFSGKLVEIGKDAIILESTRMRQQPMRIFIRIETIVAIYRIETMVPRGPFDWGFTGPAFNQQQSPGESESKGE